jgi:methylated-DNA-protein-cysteine methyltransferase-like protein
MRTPRADSRKPHPPPVRARPVSAGAARAAARAAAILEVVRSIPRGCVTTYGQVAVRAGLPRQARLVGRVLGQLPAGSAVPWHRVVAAGGRIALPAGSAAAREQLERLSREGVTVASGRIDLDRHGASSPAGDLDRWLWAPRMRPAAGSRSRRGL